MSIPIDIPKLINQNNSSTDTDSSVSISPISNQRCVSCNKKLKIIEQISGTCKCGGVFCSKHKFTNSHPCSLEAIKQLYKKNLETNNPKITMRRLEQI